MMIMVVILVVVISSHLHNQAPYPVDPVLVDRLGEEEGVAGDRPRRECPLNLLWEWDPDEIWSYFPAFEDRKSSTATLWANWNSVEIMEGRVEKFSPSSIVNWCARKAFNFGDERTNLTFKNIHLADTGEVLDLELLSVREEHLLSSENLGRICFHYDDIIFLVFVCQHPLYLFANIQ